MKESVMYTKEALKQQMVSLGLAPGDTVLIHTSFKAVGQVEGGPDGFLDAFCEYLSEGLFLVPTHTWDNVNADQPIYRVDETVPCIGLVPRTAAFRPDGIRSLHPTHSIWAHGVGAEDFIRGEELAQSPAPVGGSWWKLGEAGAKILLIGVTHNRNTFIHAVDEIADLPGRLTEPWNVTVIDREGKAITHPFRRHAHGRTGSANFDNFERAFVELGAQTMGQLGDATVRVIDAAKCRDVLLRIYSRTEEHLCLERREIPEELWRE